MTTSPETPVGVTVDLGAQLASDARDLLVAAIVEAQASGDTAAVQANSDQLIVLMQQPEANTPAVQIAELEGDELAAVQAQQAGALSMYQGMKTGELTAALRSTDHWVIDAVADGTTITDTQKAYRDQLNSLIVQVAAAKDIPAVDAIAVPDPPPTS